MCIGAPYPLRAERQLGRCGVPAAATIGVCSPWCGSLWVGWSAGVRPSGGPAVQRAWPVFLRVQILATSATLSLVAAWRLTSVGQLLGPLALSAGMWLLLGATLLSRGERSAGPELARGVGRDPQRQLLGGPDGGGLRRIGRDA